MARIAFIGLGRMGGPMALNLIRKGHDLIANDLSKAAMERFAAEGGTVAETILPVIKNADAVITMVSTGEHAAAIYEGSQGVIANAQPGTLLIDCSSIDVDTSRRLASTADAAGLTMIDAPVSGGVTGSRNGTLTFMVGGTEPALAQARSLLEAMGTKIFHAGSAGSGQAAKICNNMLTGMKMIATSEAFLLGEKLGLNRQTLFDIISVSSGQSWVLSNYLPVPGPVPSSPANRNYDPGFTVRLMLKDMRLCQQAAAAVDSPVPLSTNAIALYQILVNSGAAEKDFSIVSRLLAGDLSEYCANPGGLE